MINPRAFVITRDKRHAGIKIQPIDHQVSVEELRAAFALSDFSDWALDLEGLLNAVHRINHCGDASEAEGDTLTEELAVIAQRVDASISISVAEDAMSATAQITTARGGEPISLPRLVNALHEARVCFGLQTQRTLRFISESISALPGTVMEEVIALGRPPENGQNTRFKRLVMTPRERLRQPQPRDHGKVDMRDLGHLCTVKPGDVLMRVIPHTLGKEGKNVLGEVLPNQVGQPIELEVGEGTRIASYDPHLLLADSVGLPIEIEHGMRIDDVLSVSEVNVGTGHLNFSGSIVINGDVREEMRVVASGDIHVIGYVDSAYLESGGDILVEKAIIGHRKPDDSFSCELKATGAVQARNAQFSKISANGEIQILRELTHCQIFTPKSVQVMDQGGRRGQLVGGEVEAGETIEAIVLGSPAGPHTYLSIIGEYPALEQQKNELIAKREEIYTKLDDLLDAQVKLGKIKDHQKRVELQTKVSATLKHHHIQLAELEDLLEENQKAFEGFFTRSKLLVRKQMFANVHLSIAGVNISSTREYGPTQSSMDDGKLSFVPLT
ncbi:DUF342 domain-containing protein [Celerinatantimonas sp. YJH-8]|uniref:DUF342 domain-containing protein n=1 Tax=Celerinatantimonas sp. YJH-8 TaxID=3228714 RepID=UPI0038C1F2F8